MLRLRLPFALRSVNELRRMSVFAYRDYRRGISWNVKIAAGGALQAGPIAHARVTIKRCSPGMLDPDNLVGSVKPLLDVLQPLSRRHPSGLGIIANDRADCLDLRVEQARSAGAGWTDVLIEELP